MVYRTSFVGGNFMSRLLCTLKPKKHKNRTKPSNFFQKKAEVFFPAPDHRYRATDTELTHCHEIK